MHNKNSCKYSGLSLQSSVSRCTHGTVPLAHRDTHGWRLSLKIKLHYVFLSIPVTSVWHQWKFFLFLFNFYVNFKAVRGTQLYQWLWNFKVKHCFLVMQRRKNISLCVSIKKHPDVSEMTKMFSTIKIIVKSIP